MIEVKINNTIQIAVYAYMSIYLCKKKYFSTVIIVLVYTLLKLDVIADNGDSSAFDAIMHMSLSFSRSFLTRRRSRTVWKAL